MARALAVAQRPVLDRQPFLDDLGDRQTRRQRAIGVLEHDLDVAAQRPHRLPTEAVDTVAEIRDASFGADQPQDREPERGLAGAGFAHDSHGLALSDREGDAVDRLYVSDGAAQ